MFIYENGNSLNLTLVSNKPVENPDVVIKGYKNGAAVVVGEVVYGVKNGEEFDGKANLLVYEKDDKLAITFNGPCGIDSPEVTINSIGDDKYELVINNEDAVTLAIVGNIVEPVTKGYGRRHNPVKEEPAKEEPTPVVEEPVVETPVEVIEE